MFTCVGVVRERRRGRKSRGRMGVGVAGGVDVKDKEEDCVSKWEARYSA